MLNKGIRIHIIHNDTSLNRGSGAIVISATETISRLIPNVEFSIESIHPEIDQKTYPRVKVINKVISSPQKAIESLVRVILWKILCSVNIKAKELLNTNTIKTYYHADLLLDLAGDNLCVPSSANNPFFWFKRNVLALAGHTYIFMLGMLLNKPIIIYAQTIGPLGIMRLLIKMFLNKVSLITVREVESFNYLKKIGISKPRIYLTADPAFLLPTPSAQRIDEIMKKERIKRDIPTVGISPSSESAIYHYKHGENKFVRFLSRAIDEIVDKCNAQVILIPHSIWKGHGGNDQILCEKIYKLVKRKENVRLLMGRYDPITVKGIISRCNMFIGMRMHACISSLSSCVPTLAIGHNPKYLGIMRMANQESYVCQVENLSYDNLIRRVMDLWKNKDNVERIIRSNINAILKLALFNAELLRDFISNGILNNEYPKCTCNSEMKSC